MYKGLIVLQAFEGAKAGFIFGTGEFGLGYYTDTTKIEISEDAPEEAALSQPQHAASKAEVPPLRVLRTESALAPSTSLSPCLTQTMLRTAGKPLTGEAGRNNNIDNQQQLLGGSAQSPEDVSKAPDARGAEAETECISRAELQSAPRPECRPGGGEPLSVESAATEAGKQPEVKGAVPVPEAGVGKRRLRHYWGQAVQYLEKSTDVTKGEPLIPRIQGLQGFAQRLITYTCRSEHPLPLMLVPSYGSLTKGITHSTCWRGH